MSLTPSSIMTPRSDNKIFDWKNPQVYDKSSSNQRKGLLRTIKAIVKFTGKEETLEIVQKIREETLRT
jgi:hypothetical protein